MNPSLFCGIVILMLADPGDFVVREPWRLSIDERIQLRLDPAAIEARRRAWTADQTSAFQREASTGAGSRFIIDGRRNPELLLPFELMDFLLSGVSGPMERQQAFRRTVSDGIAAAGWRHDEFWRELERIRAADSPRPAHTRRARREPTAEAEGREHCAARAHVLALARERFGHEAFDRFLYLAVAPKITTFAEVPTSAEHLRAAEEGCR